MSGKGGPLGLWECDGPIDTHVTILQLGRARQLWGGGHCGTDPSLKLGKIFLRATPRGCNSLQLPPPEPFAPRDPPSWAQTSPWGKNHPVGCGFSVQTPYLSEGDSIALVWGSSASPPGLLVPLLLMGPRMGPKLGARGADQGGREVWESR